MTDCSFVEDLDLDGEASTGDSVRRNHAGDWETAEDDLVYPDVVVWAESTDDVSAVLAAADDRGVPVTPYAAGTGLEGGATPVHRGISLDTTRLDDVVEVRPDDLQVEVEAGVIGSDVDEAVARHGLFFPPLPTSGELSTIGGMIGTDASGMRTVKYGEVRDWVLELEAVLADGRVVRAGSRARKTSSGYNLKDLIVGSEGTLAVVTKATLRLAGRPQQTRAGRAVFPSLDHAAAAVSDAVTSGVDVATIELIDETSAAMANAYGDRDLPVRPMVFLEFHADAGIDEEVAFCRSIFESHDVETFAVGDGSDADDLWKARRDLGEGAISDYDPDREMIHPGDVTVPLSAYPDAVRLAQDLEAEYGQPIAVFGHAGDGNVHYAVLADPDDPDEVETAEEMYSRMVSFAIDSGGTITGEHGIGLGKRAYLAAEHGEAAVDVMRSIKRALDPRDTLNPGKIFPETARGERVRVDPDAVGSDSDAAESAPDAADPGPGTRGSDSADDA